MLFRSTAIQDELDTLKKVKTWGIVERPKERNVIKNKWVFRIKKDSAGKVEDSLLRVSHKCTALIITTHGHPWQNSDQSGFYLPLPLNTDGLLICSISTALIGREFA